jgi:hypothetical protein
MQPGNVCEVAVLILSLRGKVISEVLWLTMMLPDTSRYRFQFDVIFVAILLALYAYYLCLKVIE